MRPPETLADLLRVGVVADDPLARGGIAALLLGRSDVAVAGAFGTLAAVQPEGLDAVVWDLPPEGAGELEGLPLPIVALVSDADRAAEALAAGADGVLDRAGDGNGIAAALRAVACDLLVVDRAFADLLSSPERAEPVALAEPLTPREEQTLALLAEGLSNRRIAKRLGVSEHTAKFHVAEVMAKLGARNRTDAVVRAARLGMLVL